MSAVKWDEGRYKADNEQCIFIEQQVAGQVTDFNNKDSYKLHLLHNKMRLFSDFQNEK